MYHIRTVMALTGIPAVTIRAWENRYGVIVPSRTDGGHRVYSEQDVDDLRWLKSQVENNGINISQASQMLKRKKLEQLLEKSRLPDGTLSNKVSVSPGKSETSVRDVEALLQSIQFSSEDVSFEKWISELYDALTSFQNDRAHLLAEAAFSRYGEDDVFHHILAPLLHRIGDEWENATLTMAQEHFASTFVMLRFSHFFQTLPVLSNLPKWLAFCPSGEHHQIGLLMFSLFLRKKGADVIYLGPNTTEDGLSELIEANGIRHVCVSLTDVRLLQTSEQMIERLLAKHSSLQFLLGGLAFHQMDQKLEKFRIGDRLADWENWFANQFG